MAFIATQLSAAQAFDRLKTQASASKQYLATQRALMVAPSCDAQVPLSVIQHLGQVNALMSAWAGTPGLAAYAQAQYNDATYDVVAEFNNMKTAMQNAQTTLTNMFPKDASAPNPFILYQSIKADGTLLNRTFTAAQLAGAVSTIDSVIATIN
jgi:parvulin-like peptidyl-prolyl isomerase